MLYNAFQSFRHPKSVIPGRHLHQRVIMFAGPTQVSITNCISPSLQQFLNSSQQGVPVLYSVR